MTAVSPNVSRNTLFDEFLQAPILQEKNGMMLSVISALARLNLDPWAEAARLAKMPKDVAFSNLRDLVFEVADKPRVASESDDVALRLTKLLPQEKAVALPNQRWSLNKQMGTYKANSFTSNVRFIIIVGSVAFWLSVLLSGGTHPYAQHPDHSPDASADFGSKTDSKH